MRNFCSLVTLAALAAMPVLAQAYRAPRMADGHPNFNGIWQAMNTANWDIQDHSAAPATRWQTGSIGAVPAGAGNFQLEYVHRGESCQGRVPGRVEYECRIEGSRASWRPWKISMTLYRKVEKNAQLMEFKCVEFSEELLYGQFKKQPTK